jgi:hypothetical protein
MIGKGITERFRRNDSHIEPLDRQGGSPKDLGRFMGSLHDF